MSAPHLDRLQNAPHYYSDLLIAASRAAKALSQTGNVTLHVQGDATDPNVWRASLEYEQDYEEELARKYNGSGATPREAVAVVVVAFFTAICKVADTHAEAAAAMRLTIAPFLTPENTGT